MKPVSVAGIALALSAGISGQISTSFGPGRGLDGSTTTLTIATSTAATIKSTAKATSSETKFSQTKRAFSTSDTKPASLTQNPPTAPIHKHIDTIGDTVGVPSTQDVLNAKLPAFCCLSPAHTEYCKQLQNTVSACVDSKNSCADTTTARALLAWPLDNNLCSTAHMGNVVGTVCRAWWIEARRCRNMSKRGPCAYHHVLYMLRLLRDFVALPAG